MASEPYKRKNSEYYHINYYVNGKRKFKSLGVRDLKLARHLSQQLEVELRNGKFCIPSDIKVEEALKRYDKYSKIKKAPKTYLEHKYLLSKFFTFTGPCKLKDIKKNTIDEFLNSYHDHGCKPKTVNSYLIIVKAFLNWCKSEDFLQYNPADKIKQMTVPENAPRFLTQEEISNLLKVSKGSHLYPLIIMALYTGIRIGTLIKLEWKDINLSDMTVTIPGFKTKVARFRVLPLPGVVSPLLNTKGAKNGFLFTYKGKPFKSIPSKSLRRLFKLAGIQGKGGWHALRHSTGTYLAVKGVDIRIIAEILGHSKIQTSKIYTSLGVEHLRKAMKGLSFKGE